MTDSEPARERAVRPGTDRKRRRGHAAAGGRILVAGIGTAATVTLAAFMSRSEAATEQPSPAVVELPAVAAPASAGPKTVIQVVVRRRAPGAAGAPAPAALGRAAPSVTTPRPAPAPAPAVAVPVARSHAS